MRSRYRWFFGNGRSQPQRARQALSLELLEDRLVPSTFAVTSLGDSGPGSLRQALLNANAHPGTDAVQFSVAGTIQLTSGALPAITGSVTIDGTSAPGYAGQPVVEVDFNHFAGLRLSAGSSYSALRALALVDATGAGVTVNSANHLTIAGNFIGVGLDGATPAGNSGDGIQLINSSGDTIGNTDPASSVDYTDTSDFPVPVTAWQGIRAGDTSGQYLISGTSGDNGLLYEGPMDGSGTPYMVNYPGAAATSVYGPNNLGGGSLQLVGSYRNADALSAPVTVNGFLFQGTTGDLATPSAYTTIDYPGAKYNYVHSTMGGLAVGNYDSPLDHGKYNLPLGPGHAYIYGLASGKFLTDIVYPGSRSDTAYGIWYNGGTSYTICGGYSTSAVNNFANQDQPIGQAYLVDYDAATGTFSHWTSFSYPDGVNFVTHFEGISSTAGGVYTLNADSVQAGSTNPTQGSWVTVTRNTDGSFGPATWVNLNDPSVDPTTNITSSNSVYGDQVVGLVVGTQSTPYQATVNIGFQLSNVISGNGASGIELDNAHSNQIAMNYIGTDLTGTAAVGNGKSGILVTAGSAGNMIGGEVTGGNDPTQDVFGRPPQGNLISGNLADGVLLTGGATQNQLSGNFIGTDATGDTALGNHGDGVAIQGASGNRLIGCTLQQDPFVFYNVISGNLGNGLRVTNSNNTTIQANFFGMGSNNDTALGNQLIGVVIEGTSMNTVMGGPIPLGNVDAANRQNGLVVRGQAGGFTSYNTFCGLAAFSTNPTFGNGLDGMLITATGGNILIRTNVITCNGADGIEIGGSAQGVRVTGNIIGLNTDGVTPMGNLGNGIEVDGNAHNIVIGGPQPTFNIIPQNAISANGANGVAVTGHAANVQVSHSYIGTNIAGLSSLGNANDGVYIGPGTSAVTIGSTDPSLLTVISGNGASGVELNGTHGDTVVGCLIGTDASGRLPLGNGASGVLITNSLNNVIGRAASTLQTGAGGRRLASDLNTSVISTITAPGIPANIIAFNDGNGVSVVSGNSNTIYADSIYSNSLPGIALAPGANNNVAAPVLTNVQALPMALRVSGTLHGARNSLYTVEFFASDANAGSGRYLLGAEVVRTNAAGTASFTFLGPLPPDTAPDITATATDMNGNTSIFSAAASWLV